MSGGDLVVQDRGGGDVKRFELRSGVATLGAHPDCDIRVLLPHVLDHHATMAVHARETLIRDLSNGGTLVNGCAVSVHALQHGDIITLGDRSMRWEYTRAGVASSMTPRPALVMKSVRKRGRPTRVSEVATRRLDPDIHLALEMKHRASMPGGTKQVAIVQPRRRDVAGDIIETKTRLITKPHRPYTIKRTPKKSPEPSTSQNLGNSSRKRTPKINTLHSETKASQWIASRKTPKRTTSVVDMATPKNEVYVHVATPRPLKPYVEKSPSKMLASVSPKKVLGKKATPLRTFVLRKAVTPKVTPLKKISPRKSKGTPRNKVEKIQAPLVMDEKKKAALMMITRTPQSKFLAAKSAIPVLVKKSTSTTIVPKPKVIKTPVLQKVTISPKNLSPNRSSRGRKRQSGNRSDSALDSTDSEGSQTRSTRSNVSLPDALSPLPPSPHKSALKNPSSKKKHNKTDSIKFDLSNLESEKQYSDTSEILFYTNDPSEDEMILQYSDISPQSSPRKSPKSRSSKILEKSLGHMPMFTINSNTINKTQSPNKSKSNRSSLILRNALDIANPSPTTSRKSDRNMETYSIVDLVSLDSNGSESLYSSADSTSTSSIIFGTPSEKRISSRSRGKSSIVPNLVSSSTPFPSNTPRASRSKINVTIPQKRSISTPQSSILKQNTMRSKSLSTPLRNGNSFIINNTVAQSNMGDTTYFQEPTYNFNDNSLTLFDATLSPKSTKQLSRNTTRFTNASITESPRRSRSQESIKSNKISNSSLDSSSRKSRSNNISEISNISKTISSRKYRSQESVNTSELSNSTMTKSPRKSRSQESINTSELSNSTMTKSPRKSRSQERGNTSTISNGSVNKSSRKSRNQQNVNTSEMTNASITKSPRSSRSQESIRGSSISNGSVNKSSRKSGNQENNNTSKINNATITKSPRKSRSQDSINTSRISNTSVNKSSRKSRSQQSLNTSEMTNTSITKSSRSRGQESMNTSEITNASINKSSRKSQNQDSINTSDINNATITKSPRKSRSQKIINASDISNRSINKSSRKSRSQDSMNTSTFSNGSLNKSARKSRSQESINTSRNSNGSANKRSRKSRSQESINTSEITNASITRSPRMNRQENINITPNISKRRTQSAGRGSSKKNTPNISNTDGQITPPNQSISPQDSSTPILHMEKLLVSNRPISNKKGARKTIHVVSRKPTLILRGANTDPKKRGRVSRINLESAKKVLLRRQSNDSGDSNRTNETAPKPSTSEKSTPKSTVKLVPEQVKQQHSTAKKPKSKRSIIDHLDESDIVKQLFNSPVKRKLSQSMTEFNRSLTNENNANKKRARRTIAVCNITPDQSFVEDNFDTVDKLVNKTTRSPNLEGIKRLNKKNSPRNDLTNVRGVKSLFKTPRGRKSPRNDLSNVSGVKAVFKGRTPKNDLTNVRGVKQVFAPSPRNDLRRVSGVKALFQSQRKSVKNDLSDVKGVKTLFITSPRNDLRNVSGVKKILKINSPKNDLRDVRGVKRVFRQDKSQLGLSDLSGVEELFNDSNRSNSENLFDQLVGKPVVKNTYSKSFAGKMKSNQTKTQASKSLLPVAAISNNVEEWLDKEINRRLQKDASLKASKTKNVTLNKSKNAKELQRLLTDTITGALPLQNSRNRSRISNVSTNVIDNNSLPLKKRSLVTVVNVSGLEKKVLPIKKRVIVHSTPVKANRTLLETTEMGRVSPIAITDTTEIEAVIIKSPVQPKNISKAKPKGSPKKRGAKPKTTQPEATKTTPKPSPRKTRNTRAIPKNSPIKTNIKKRRTSLVVSKKTPKMSPQKPQNEPKPTRRTIKKVQVTPKKDSPIKKRVGRSAATTSPGRRNAKKATPVKKSLKKEAPKPKRGASKAVVEVETSITKSPKVRTTRAKPKPITPKTTKPKSKKETAPAVVITKPSPKFSPEPKKPRNARQVKTKGIKVVSPPKPKRGKKVEVIEEPRGRKRKIAESPKVATPKPKRNTKKNEEASKNKLNKPSENKRGRKAKTEEAPMKKPKKNEEVIEKPRRGNAKIAKPIETKKLATKKAATTKPVVEEKPTRGRKRKADTPPPVAEPPQRRARGKKVETEPVKTTGRKAAGKPTEVTKTTRATRTRK